NQRTSGGNHFTGLFRDAVKAPIQADHIQTITRFGNIAESSCFSDTEARRFFQKCGDSALKAIGSDFENVAGVNQDQDCIRFRRVDHLLVIAKAIFDLEAVGQGMYACVTAPRDTDQLDVTKGRDYFEMLFREEPCTNDCDSCPSHIQEQLSPS